MRRERSWQSAIFYAKLLHVILRIRVTQGLQTLLSVQTLVDPSDRRHLNLHCYSIRSTGEARAFHDPVSCT